MPFLFSFIQEQWGDDGDVDVYGKQQTGNTTPKTWVGAYHIDGNSDYHCGDSGNTGGDNDNTGNSDDRGGDTGHAAQQYPAQVLD